MNGNSTQHNSQIADFDKVPPQSTQAEEAVLGAIMVDSSCMDEVAEILTPAVFYKEAHIKIFSAALELFNKNKYADLVSITEYLRNSGELESVGGPLQLTRISSNVISTAMVSQHSLIIKAHYIQREMIRIGNELLTRGYNSMEEPGDLIEYAEAELYKVGDIASSKEPEKISLILVRIAKMIEQREKSKLELTGVPSGLINLDRITLGWQPGDLIILAARPSMGKSALAIQFAKMAAELGHPVLMFSLEMSDTQLGERYLTIETGQDSYDLKRGRNIQWAVIEKALDKNVQTPLWIEDSAHMNIYEFRSKVRRAKKRHNIELVICDYLNLFTGNSEKDNMSEKYGSISKMFKSVAKECGVAVMALAQLNRSPEMRANQFPKLSDLRNSGEIEQDADIVLFPVRFKMFGLLRDKDSNRDLTNMAQIEVAKNRNGMVGTIEVKVSEDCMKWEVEEPDPAMWPEIKDFTESKLPY